MSARSSRRSAAIALAIVAVLTSCHRRREGDPTHVTARALQIARTVPVPGGVRDCKPEELAGGIEMTQRTVLQLAKLPLGDAPELDDWANPSELDSPASRVLADPASDEGAIKSAAADWLLAPFYIVYRIDIVNAPMALGIKDLKIGTLGGRVFRYDRAAQPVCVVVFNVQNDKATSDLAIKKSDRAMIDARIEKALREDLTHQYLLGVPGGPKLSPAAQ
jgi:hypothetical protein